MLAVSFTDMGADVVGDTRFACVQEDGGQLDVAPLNATFTAKTVAENYIKA